MMTMNCEKLERLIELFILDEIDTGERVAIEAHLSDCPVCRGKEREYRSAISIIKQSGGHGPESFDFNRNLQMAIGAEIEKASIRLRFKQTFAAISSIAACLIIGLALWNNLFSPSLNKSALAFGEVELWEYSNVQSVSDEFVIHGSNMYMIDSSGNGRVSAIDVDSGRKKWYAEFENCSHIAVDETSVYCITDTGQNEFDLIAMDIANGEMKWRYSQECFSPLEGASQPSILSNGNICWVVDSTVNLLQASNGKVIWSYSIPEEYLLSSAAVEGNSLYVSGAEGIYCLDVDTGTELWRVAYSIEMDKKTRPLLAASETHLYTSLGLSGDKGILLSIDINDRKVNWAKVMSDVSQICVINEKLYVRNDNVQALDRQSGELLWAYASGGGSGITYSNGKIYFVDSNGSLTALYEQSGNKVWQLAGMNSCDAFVKVGKTGYIRTNEGTIRKIIFKG